MAEPKMIHPTGNYTRPGPAIPGGPGENGGCPPENPSGCFKEAVCIDASRIYDSCSDKDCLEDLPVLFTDQVQPLIDQAVNVKVRSAEVSRVFLEVEPVAFHQGYYSVDITFFFEIGLSVYTPSTVQPVLVTGLSTFSKKVILYGSDGNVRVFRSDCQLAEEGETTSMPRAIVQAVDPIALRCQLVECPAVCPCPPIPRCVASRYEGNFVQPGGKGVYVTLGLFTIVQLERKVQMLIPAYDFCIPDKECVSTTDDPCEVFKKIQFPTNAFFPPKLPEQGEQGCGCGSNR